MTIRLDPKADFCRDKQLAGKHQDIVASRDFHEAVKAALLEYQLSLIGGDPTILAATSLKLQGAKEFIYVLMNLGEPKTPPRQGMDDALEPPEEALAKKFGYTPKE